MSPSQGCDAASKMSRKAECTRNKSPSDAGIHRRKPIKRFEQPAQRLSQNGLASTIRIQRSAAQRQSALGRQSFTKLERCPTVIHLLSLTDKRNEDQKKQNKTKQNKTKQNKTKQNKTKQNKTKTQQNKNKKQKQKQNKNKTKQILKPPSLNRCHMESEGHMLLKEEFDEQEMQQQKTVHEVEKPFCSFKNHLSFFFFAFSPDNFQ
jgi:hypothetical protein